MLDDLMKELRHQESKGNTVAGEAADTIVLLLGKIDYLEETAFTLDQVDKP